MGIVIVLSWGGRIQVVECPKSGGEAHVVVVVVWVSVRWRL
jgi:hypothetical protein